MENHKYKIFLLFLLPLLFENCFYPTYKASMINIDTLQVNKFIKTQTKIVTTSNSIILLPNGFTYDNNSISGRGNYYSFGATKEIQDSFQINTDTITAMITYNEIPNGGRTFGSLLMGLTGPPLTFLGIYCMSCPKCCFGSCPTVYLFDGNNYNLQCELFSECISKQLENSDLDLLSENIVGDSLKIRITNEALETHYINKFEVLLAEHSKSTKLYPTDKDELLVFSIFFKPISANDKNGNSILQSITKDDNDFYRSGVEKINEIRNGVIFDFVDITVPSNAKKLLLKYRNTLLSTTLLYDVVLGSQGIKGIEWTNKMNEDPIYAAQFKTVYEMFSGIKIKLLKNGEWKEIGYFKDAGPLNWKYLALELPENNEKKNQKLRFEFIPDNFMIDYAAYDTTLSNGIDYTIQKLSSLEISNYKGQVISELEKYIGKEDKDYLKTEPGDCYNLKYSFKNNPNKTYTALIKSKGYYNEWIRKSWITNSDPNYNFDLYNIKNTLTALADSWIENSDLLEEEFFKSKVSLKEEK